jgi:hypothetical protein
LRVARAIRFGERVRLDLIAEGFNLFNRFNEASASPFLTMSITLMNAEKTELISAVHGFV